MATMEEVRSNPQQRVGKLGTGVSHGNRSVSCAILYLGNLITTELNSMHQLGQQRHDRCTAIGRLNLTGLEMTRMWDFWRDTGNGAGCCEVLTDGCISLLVNCF